MLTYPLFFLLLQNSVNICKPSISEAAPGFKTRFSRGNKKTFKHIITSEMTFLAWFFIHTCGGSRQTFIAISFIKFTEVLKPVGLQECFTNEPE